ncbi:uncharacterized protein M437DRAFT_56475 [Aureobasidium melanogenum CBS 110374]|uniref:Integral membrane protein, Mpv17/PMP22 family n=1 Tax=Aureobasidium melanogenum (strain CBS 110374) TaxID=1043003 RepID=A0A074VKR5_AURM1|nr:uncharacterized protein M437DRAFT_56475 [Aureobasidium melanogenum CBS 110374]KEQ59684.1 hypothetical protein M437DRAFT_56475 [Aureobasidium melanogenum CBS 110374]
MEPIVKATIQAAILSAISNTLAQLISCHRAGHGYTLDTNPLVTFVTFSLLSCPPNYLWQSWLESTFPGYTSPDDAAVEKKIDPAFAQPPASSRPKALSIKNTAIKFALDQTLGAAVNNALFIVGIAFLKGQSVETALSALQKDFFPLLFAGQKLWPLVSIISFTLVPLEHRTVFGGIIGVGWGVFLSLMANDK